ncbi:uncharacterized protein DC041_0007760 [Schistosoma bovis]|uniref:Uncharacterized protein n=1 Tax=Schistosoma bovis TaxID=6184 RepID=A0A430Q9G4_SCHBO|nr:uncharacterized protein DC041_0007760 [Schistosoma bovis]
MNVSFHFFSGGGGDGVKASTKKSDNIRSTEGIRIDEGFQIHLHCKPITKQGIIAYNGPFYCPNHCCSILNNNSIINIIQCDCPCHRIIEYKPIETIVFIGHANVFRYWICKLLQLPIEGWLRLSLGHGSISTFIITNDEFIIHSKEDNNNNSDDNDDDDDEVKYTKQLRYGSIVTLNHLGDVELHALSILNSYKNNNTNQIKFNLIMYANKNKRKTTTTSTTDISDISSSSSSSSSGGGGGGDSSHSNNKQSALDFNSKKREKNNCA